VVCLTLLWTSGMMPWTHLLRSTAGNCNWGLCGLRGWGGGNEVPEDVSLGLNPNPKLVDCGGGGGGGSGGGCSMHSC
jgi:hypothetical protein